MKYCGIDLHSNNSVVSVVEEEDHVVAEKRLPNDLEKIIGLIKPWEAEFSHRFIALMVCLYRSELLSRISDFRGQGGRTELAVRVPAIEDNAAALRASEPRCGAC